MKKSQSYANANIALVKYWGKSDIALNIPAMPSLSMTLDGLGCKVCVEPSSTSSSHELFIDDEKSLGPEFTRLSVYLEQVRGFYSFDGFLKISSKNFMPMSAGLASSAAFFAALATALNDHFGLNLSPKSLSRLARLGSASAARSIFSKWALLEGGEINDDEAHALPIILPDSLDLAMLIAVTSTAKKAISSRDAMKITGASSPYYPAFLATHRGDFKDMQAAIRDGNFHLMGELMEHSCMKMHACMMAARPSINYFNHDTVKLIHFIYEIRKKYGPIAFFTIDAGPNVKILCRSQHLELVKSAFSLSGLCQDIYVSRPGLGAYVVES